ncbi:MAG: flavin reductase family protein [bacterium]
MKATLEKWYSALSPRSTVLIGTVNKDGVSNAAPFSFAMPVSGKPPLVAFASAPKRHTLANIRATGEFTVNVPGKELLGQLWECASNFPEGVSEIKEARLTEIKVGNIKAPGIKECFAIFACKLHSEIPAGDHVIVIGEIVETEIRKGKIVDGKFDPYSVSPLLHIGGEDFTIPGEKLVVKI